MRRKCFVLLSLLAFSSFSLLANEARRGEKLFEEKKFKESRDAFLNAEIDEPSQLQHAYNRGLSELKLGEFEKAAEAFQKSSLSDEDSLKKDSLYNLGHALYGKGDLEGSLKAFENYLKLDPESKEAKENKEWLKKKIEEQKKQQQQNKDDKKDSDKNENKDENEKDKNENSEKNQDQNKEQDKNSEKNQDQDKEQDKNENSEKNKDENKQDQDENSGDQKEEQNKNESSEEKDKKDEQGKNEEDKEEQEDKNSSSDEKKEQKGASSGEETKKDQATKEEIERLLRAIDNMQQVYGVPPKVPKQKKKMKKDW